MKTRVAQKEKKNTYEGRKGVWEKARDDDDDEWKEKKKKKEKKKEKKKKRDREEGEGEAKAGVIWIESTIHSNPRH